MTTKLVLVLSDKEYKRFDGKTCTNHVISEEKLTKEHIEEFRINPSDFQYIEPESA